MLKNELHEIEARLLLPNIPEIKITDIELDELCIRIYKAWEDAVFSDTPEYVLKRYFHFQLEGISNLSDTLYDLPKLKDFDYIQRALLLLIEHLKIYYSTYFNLDSYAPFTYRLKKLDLLKEKFELIRETLQKASINFELAESLFTWLDEMGETGIGVHYTFKSLNYLEYCADQISRIKTHSGNAEIELVDLLSKLNFNHLAFLVYRQNSILDILKDLPSIGLQLNYLQEKQAAVLSCPTVKSLAYDSNWPSIKIMLSEWLNEEIRLAEVAADREIRSGFNILKLQLDLPVSHLAYLIRLFFEEGKFATENLKEIFSFFATNYRTKRQPLISPGSLSKEYYSIDQHTAARVLDLLQKMVSRINRNFFPVMVAAGIAIHAYQGTH